MASAVWPGRVMKIKVRTTARDDELTEGVSLYLLVAGPRLVKHQNPPQDNDLATSTQRGLKVYHHTICRSITAARILQVWPHLASRRMGQP